MSAAEERIQEILNNARARKAEGVSLPTPTAGPRPSADDPEAKVQAILARSRERSGRTASAPEPEQSGRLGKIWDQAEARTIAGSQRLAREAGTVVENSALGGFLERAGDAVDATLLTNSDGEANLLGRIANFTRQRASEADGIPRGLVGGPDVSNTERAAAMRSRGPSEIEMRARQRADEYEAQGLAPKPITEIRGLRSGAVSLLENLVASGPQMAATVASGGLSSLLAPTLYGGEVNEEIINRVGENNVSEQTRVLLSLGGGSLMGALDKIGIASALEGLGRKELAELAAAKGLSKLLVARGVPTALANVAETAVVEAGTEALQEGVVMGAATAAGAEYTPEEAAKRLALAGGTGGLVGGGLRAATETAGLVTRNREQPDATGTQLDILSEEEAQLAAEAKAEQIAQERQAQEEAVRVERSVRESRDKYVSTFLPEKEFVTQRDKSREADVLDPSTELGTQFREWRLENDIYPANEAEAKAASKEFLKSVTPKDDRVAARREWLAALDQHAAQMLELEQAVAGNVQPELPIAPDTETQGETPAQGELPLEAPPTAPTPAERVASIAASRGVELAPETLEQIQNDIDQIQTLEPTERVAALNGLVAKYAQAAKAPARQNAARQPVAPTAQAAPAEPKPQRTTKKDEARAYAVEQLGENWAEIDPGLTQMIEDGKSIYGKSSKFRRRVDKAKAEQEAETTAPAEATPTVDVPAVVAEKPKGLSKGESAVWDVLSNAFRNNDVDTVIQPDGTWNATKIAEMAGLKSKQAADVAIKRLRPKIAKAYGTSEQAIGERLRETAKEKRTVEEAPAPDAPVTVLDQAELADGGAVSTIASAGQGAYTGVREEDRAFTEARAAEPNPVADQRAEEAKSVRERVVKDAIKSYGMAAVQRWKSVGANGDVSFAKLSDQDKVDWILATEEHMNGYIDDAQLEADQREIATRYDADNAGITQESIDEQDRARAAVGQDQQVGEDESAEPSDPGGEGVREDREPGAAAEPDRAQSDGARESEADNTPEVAGAAQAPGVEIKRKKRTFKELSKGVKARFSVAELEATGATADAYRQATKWLLGEMPKSRVHVLTAPEDLIGLVMTRTVPISSDTVAAALDATNPYGFVDRGTDGNLYAFFFTENTTPGRERAAVMHEIGGHMGIDTLAGDVQNAAFQQIQDWITAADDTLESNLALRAQQRVEYAAGAGGVDVNDAANVRAEYIAYFLEEAVAAGVNPSVSSDLPVYRLVKRIFDAFKKALAKFTGRSDQPLYTEDFLDLARGAAKRAFVTGELRERALASARFGVEQRAAEQQSWVQRTYGQQTSSFMADLGNVFRKPVDSTKSMHNFIREHKETMPSIGVWFDKMLEAKQTRSSVIQGVERVINQARTLGNDRKALVNDFLGTSTFYQKWGYDPQWATEDGTAVTVKIDPVMKKKFDRLTPEEQQIVRDVFDHGREMRKQMREIAEAVGVAKFFKMDTGIDGPYAPLKRFGNYVGELKSEALLKAESDGDAKETEKLKSDPDHYVVSFFDTLGAAQQFANANSKEFAYAEASDKLVDFDEARPGGSQVYEKILGAVNANMAGLDQESKNAMAAMVRDMYYQSLDDSSARLSGARRLNRAGYDKDMMRAFAFHGRAQANLIAQMKHGAEIATALADARSEARKSPKKLTPIYNIVAKKFRAVMTPRSGALAAIEDNILKFNTFYMLTSSIGYHIQNFTQPMYSAAKISGDFGVGQYGKTWGAMFRGWRVAGDVINTGFLNQLTNVASIGIFGKNSNVELDIEKAPPQYRDLLETLQLRDLLDVGVEEDLNLDNQFDTGYKLPNAMIGAYEEITHRLYQAARFVEANNRIASAVAAYDMAQRNPKMLKQMKMTPTEYVLSVVEDTQGNFSQLDAPALMDVLPKMTTQFRKYQFMMVWLHVNAAKQAFKGTSPEMRAAGRRTLAMLVGHTGLAAGAIGVPAANTAMWAFSAMFGEGDEPEDLERWIRKNVEDERIADLIARGVPASLGLDMSQKLGQADIFAPYNTKFVSPDPTADGMKQFVAELFLGPTGSLVGNIGNIGDFLNRGDYYRAAEYAVPRGLRSYMEAVRYSGEGYTQRNDLVVADPRDFNAWDLISNTIGLPSTEVNKIKWSAGQRYELEQWVSKESGRIRREYVEAYDARDRAQMTELKAEWRELQDTKDRLRPMFNNSPKALRRQPVVELIKAPRRRDTEQRSLDLATGR